MAEYNPIQHSIVQATVGVWCQYECDDFIEALFDKILAEVTRAHWNVYQHSWGPSWHYDEVEDPMIPSIAFVRYYDGCECENESEHRPECRHAHPNFQHEDVQFRWYKYPGRGMSTNKNWTADEWRAWFDRCVGTIQAFEQQHMHGYGEGAVPHAIAEHERKALQEQLKRRYPQAFERHYADEETAPFRAMASAFDHLDKVQTPCFQCSAGGFGSGGGVYEGGKFGTIARTLHEDDNPDGACRNCGHVNSDHEKQELEERRRKNSDAEKRQWAASAMKERAWELEEDRKLYLHLRDKLKLAGADQKEP